MKIYTRTGDKGTTSLVGGTRVAKNSPRLEAYGTVDELNAWLGLLNTSTALPPEAYPTLSAALSLLFDIGAALATEPESTWQPDPFPAQAIADLEAAIDTLDTRLPRHNRFVLPGGHPDAARAGIARTIARRAERRILGIENVDPLILQYINRLSDYLFVLSRAINFFNGVTENYWH